MEINGEPTQGITHTRAIELIQAGGNKVLLLLRPGTGLIPDHGERGAGSCKAERVGGSAGGTCTGRGGLPARSQQKPASSAAIDTAWFL